jgi:futalosine hydrolase
MGAEDGDRFLTLQELELTGESEFVNPDPPSNPEIDQLPTVTGITVNTVHGSEGSIAAIVERCSPQVESMEGAAFMAACLMHEVPFAQIRAVSNLVERRNRDAWKMEEAIVNLNATALRFLDHT